MASQVLFIIQQFGCFLEFIFIVKIYFKLINKYQYYLHNDMLIV